MAALGEIHLRINSEKLEGDIRKAVKAALLGVFQDLQKYLEVEPDRKHSGSRPDSLGSS